MSSMEGLPSDYPNSQILLAKLAAVLPKDAKFKIYHLSTPPTKTSSLYSAPPDSRPDRTYCESHFLTVSIPTIASKEAESQDVLIFAIKVLIYSTAHDTTFFVSKADSTGFLHLLGLPKGTPSPIRSISATFLEHLIAEHQRPNLRSVISLFARAQDQYLFPGSVEYSGKHVLDDRGLIRWWCRVLDPLIENVGAESRGWDSTKGYLIVPGLDTYETSSYPPRKPGAKSSWTVGHPLRQLTRHAEDVPTRCLIPHYPDDPKARFLVELDDEITKGKTTSSGQWKSVKTIDQFWEMMAFRQECSAGRLVGFIWIVFEQKVQSQNSQGPDNSQSTLVSDCSQPSNGDADDYQAPNETPATSAHGSSQPAPLSSPIKGSNSQSLEQRDSSKTREQRKVLPKSRKRKLSGRIIPREPRIKTSTKSSLPFIPESTPYYLWAPSGRGQIVVEESDYKRSTELLLRLDFANLGLASSSTTRWVSEVRAAASTDEAEKWGQEIVGARVTEVKQQVTTAGVQTLNVGLVRKKRKPEEEAREPASAAAAPASTAPVVNVLSAGMIRKKPKA